MLMLFALRVIRLFRVIVDFRFLFERWGFGLLFDVAGSCEGPGLLEEYDECLDSFLRAQDSL